MKAPVGRSDAVRVFSGNLSVEPGSAAVQPAWVSRRANVALASFDPLGDVGMGHAAAGFWG